MDLCLIFELAKTVISNKFDLVLHRPQDFQTHIMKPWFGAVWGDLTTLPSSKKSSQTVSIIDALQSCISKFVNGEYTTGLFLTKADYSQDWFIQCLQYPHVIIKSSPINQTDQYGDRKPESHATYILFYLGTNPSLFCASFCQVGFIPGINSWSAVITNEVHQPLYDEKSNVSSNYHSNSQSSTLMSEEDPPLSVGDDGFDFSHWTNNLS
ncbi:hypothetical protein BC833DRAFT_578426 [Globomyces pollinis-pini]|nr:hypothetical protein BC833DRAFT_578426 [Globomyces pollinis-pini]